MIRPAEIQKKENKKKVRDTQIEKLFNRLPIRLFILGEDVSL